jgi:hypothetical protein
MLRPNKSFQPTPLRGAAEFRRCASGSGLADFRRLGGPLLDGSLAVTGQPVLQGPVLLVDDMVDSRWTLTVSAWLLRTNGSGEVWPMVLSKTGHDE